MILGLKTAYKTQVGKFKSGAKFKSKFRKIELPPSPPDVITAEMNWLSFALSAKPSFLSEEQRVRSVAAQAEKISDKS